MAVGDAAEDVRIGVLGPLQVRRGGTPVDIGGPKPRAVLVCLVHHLDQMVPVDALIEVLWGDDPPKSARNAVQVNISLLRRALGSGVELRTEPSGYVLASVGAHVDVADFEQLAAAAHDLVDDDPAAALDATGAALRLWRGRPAAEELDLAPLASHVVALRELRVNLEALAIGARIRSGQHRECLADAAALADEHPFREDIRALHLLALYRAGRQTEALAAYRRTRERLVEELGIDPGPELRTLHRQILEQDEGLERPGSAIEEAGEPTGTLATDNLRPEANVFVDRPEVAQIVDALAPGRLVTAVGTGGIGKSRCVAAAARLCLEQQRLTDSAWLVDLAALPEQAGDVAPTVAAALRIGQQPGASATETVVAYLAHRRALLVLDNCEHVATASTTFIEAVLAGAPTTVLLAASRVRLATPAERVVTVDRLPDDAAMALLVARIEEAGAGPFADEANRELCAVLDNYPLAIELAAARTRTLAPREIVTRLSDHPALLGSARRGTGGRHTDLATALDWSYHQLSPRARGTLDSATVFVGDFDLTSAEAVLAPDDVAASGVVDDLGELVEHHLLHRDHGRARFRMLEPIRQYRRAAASERIVGRYVEHFTASTRDAAVGLRGPDEAVWWDRIRADLPHMREAARLATEPEEVSLVDSAMMQMAITSWICAFNEPGDWAIEVLARLGAHPVDVPGLSLAAAVQLGYLGRTEECDALLDTLEAADDDARVRAVAAWVRYTREPTERRWWRRFREAAQECDDPAMLTWAGIRSGTPEGVALADELGNPTLRVNARQFWSASMPDGVSVEARRNKEELYRIALQSNNSKTIAEGQMFMALQHCYDDEPRRAGPLAAEMIERLVRTRSPFWIWHGVEVIGVMLAMVRLEAFTAEKLWAAVTASGWTPFSRTARRTELPKWVASQLSDDETERARAAGSVLDMDAAAREARKAAERMAAG